jgi:hypothetical protein
MKWQYESEIHAQLRKLTGEVRQLRDELRNARSASKGRRSNVKQPERDGLRLVKGNAQKKAG